MLSYFTDAELACKCCGQLHIDEVFLFRLNWARHITGFPWIINSGYRCRKHNAEVGSTSGNHLLGKAVDIYCPDLSVRYIIVSALISAGIPGIGIGPEFIHADANRKTPVIFIYEPI